MLSSLTKSVAAVVALTAVAQAQRPASTPICDYYTTLLLKNNTADNQLTLLTLLVNTVVIGNYTKPNVGVSVPGILAPGTYMGNSVNLLQYFDGALLSTNQGGNAGQSVSFLDGGGAKPLLMSKPADDTTSNQYFLLTHLYQFFGTLLGCTQQGMPGFPAYSGDSSMYSVHKFMGLGPDDVGYFITQVGLAAQSFGVSAADITAVATALESLFDVKCGPPTTIAPASAGPQLQSICLDDNCPLAVNASCSLYPAHDTQPLNATASSASTMAPAVSTAGTASTSATGTMSTTGTVTPSGTSTSPASTKAPESAAAALNLSFVSMGAAVLIALCFGLTA